MANNPEDDDVQKVNNAPSNDESNKGSDSDLSNNDYLDDEEDERIMKDASSEEVQNEAEYKTRSGIVTAMERLKSVFKGFIKVMKYMIDLVKAGVIGWIILAIILVIIIVIIIIFSFKEKNNKNSHVTYSSIYDTQDMINEDKKTAYKQKKEEANSVISAVTAVLTAGELRELKSQINALNSTATDYEDYLIGSYDTNAGYQILNQDGTVLTLLEKISYAYKYTDWEPIYDYDGVNEQKIAELEKQIADEKAKPSNERAWSQMTLTSKEDLLNELKENDKLLNFQLQRFKELNLLYKEKIEKDFINGSPKSKVHPDGTPVEDKVVEYFKDKYGIETNDIKEELNYYHTIIYRNFSWEQSKTENNLNDVIKFINEPKLKLSDAEEEDLGVDLSYVEYPFRARFEIMHHEVTLNLIYNSNLLNSIFDLPETKERVKKTLSNHIPLFEYVTYSKDVAGKTFYDYELYDPKYYDDLGNYKFDSSFNTKLNKYVASDNTNIDYSKVQDQARKEALLETYKMQLAAQEKEEYPDRLFIEELNELITELESELAVTKTSDEMSEDYKKNFNNVMKMQVELEEENRPYDSHNHNIIQDDVNNPKYYISFADTLVDFYTNNVKIKETLTKNVSTSEPGTIVRGSWKETTAGPSVDGCTKSYETSLDIDARQSSLKPLKVRSLLNSADYVYEKESLVKTKDEIEKIIEVERNATKWQRREVKLQTKDAQGNVISEKVIGYDYKKITNVSFTNEEKIKGKVQPWSTNENMYLNTSTYLTDFYGQKTYITEDYSDQTPGGLIDDVPGERNYTEGKIKLTYYNQTDYNDVYGPPNSTKKCDTVKSSGCGPTCMAMIITSMTTKSIDPVEMCKWSYEHGYYVSGSGTKRSFIPESAIAFGLNCNKISRKSKNDVVAALSKGHPVVEICGPGDFTTGGHFIILTGITSDGLVTVADPYSRKKSEKLWDINVIMANASTSSNEYTFWEIY